MNFERGQDPRVSLGVGYGKKLETFKNWLNGHNVPVICKNNGEKRLRVINITSGTKLETEVIRFLEYLIIEKKNIFLQKQRDTIKYKCCYGIYKLINHIPIFIVDKDMMNKIVEGDDPYNPDVLGWYTRTTPASVPSVYICLERIEWVLKELSKKIGYDERQIKIFLTAKVILHELAHALMDIGLNNEKGSEFFKWLEEPMANMITLLFTDNYPDFKKFTKAFIDMQPKYYIPGKKLYENDRYFCYWKNWWNYKKQSYNNKDYQKEQEWLDDFNSSSENKWLELYDKILANKI